MEAKLVKILTGLFIAVTLVVSSCKKNQDQIPEVLVDIQVNINNPGYIQLQAVGGWMYFDGGSRGVLVYRYSQDVFMAYERHCPYQPSNTCGTVSVDSSNLFVKDACCGSSFLITDGSLQSGPSQYPLKRYQTMWDGSAILRIYN